MKKRTISGIMAGIMTVMLAAGCGSAQTDTGTEAPAEQQQTTESAAAVSSSEEEENSSRTEEETTLGEPDIYQEVEMRIGSLKGPTTMGLVNLMKAAENLETNVLYDVQMMTQPDELAAAVVAGTVDAALVPANLASVLYNRTEGGIVVVDINTLGVLYCVTGDASISSVKDLSGKTVITTGQGATPEYAIQYLLDQNGITDCTLEFASESTEAAAMLAQDPSRIAVLPQPFVTVAQAQNEALVTAFSLSDEWDAVTEDSRLITGVTIVRREFLEAHPEEVKTFLKDHSASAELAVSDIEGTAELVAEYGIIEKTPVAKKALPYCNIVCITGEEMKTALSGYLNVLAEQNAKSIGGNIPAEDFYYTENFSE